ncbi:MAG TPA: hypothetical protein VK206_05390 [Anaerolineales bacterium]|nr:hypothetical protein [Anaerolineales bacterium]HLO29942.1 hypothetical protein [Anaerolineales bacterium]
MAREFIASTWLYKTSDPIDFIKETQERFVSIEAFFSDENSAKAGLVQKARNTDSSCNVVFDASWFRSGSTFIMKGKLVRAKFAA